MRPTLADFNAKFQAEIAAQLGKAKPVLLEAAPKDRRLRQSSKPLMNKLESRFFDVLTLTYPKARIYPQAKSYRLANGLRFKPDFTAVINGVETAVWEENCQWKQQKVLP